MSKFKKFAIWTLRHAEALYLKAHGWKHLEGDDYAPPEGYEAKKHESYHRCHAVASQRGVYAAATRKKNEDDLASKLAASVKS